MKVFKLKFKQFNCERAWRSGPDSRLVFGRTRVRIRVPTILTEGFSEVSSVVKVNAGMDYWGPRDVAS